MPYNTETSPLTAQELVNEAWDYYRELGNGWITQASQAINDFTSLQIQPIAFSVNYDVDSFLPQFVRPTKPDEPTFMTIVPRDVNAPVLDDVFLRVLGDAPEDPDLSAYLTYAPPAPPNAAMPVSPGDVSPVLAPIVIPDRPVYVLPTVPTLYDLDLPVAPNIVLPEFLGERPVFDLAAPIDGELDYQDRAYVSELQAELTASIRQMMQGSLGLPLAIEQAIFDRGRAREDRLSAKQTMEVSEDMASRGLSEPNGILAKRLREVHADNREKASGFNRDTSIKVAEIAVDNLKFAIGQGMAQEQMLIQLNQSINERALKVALAAREFSISRYNALISYANLQQTAYATDAQVWRDRIAGELSKLEVFKAQIDGQRLVGEINKDLIQQYVAQFEGVKALADFYRTDIEAAKTKGEMNLQLIQAAKLKLEEFSTRVDAWGKQQDGYKTQVEAALGTTKFAETLASIFNTRMQGYKTKGESYFQEGRFQLERNGQTLDLFKSNLAAAEQDLRGQMAQLEAQLSAYGSKVKMYEADGSIATAESAAHDRTTSLLIESEKNRVDVQLKSAQQSIEQMLKIAEIMVENIRAKGSALAQLAASSQSGVNFGASLSGSLGTSYSFSRSQSWSGETPDHDASGSGAF